jgi:Na+-transporting NADH:ubiquinone oxidoreductase subunit NqrB
VKNGKKKGFWPLSKLSSSHDCAATATASIWKHYDYRGTHQGFRSGIIMLVCMEGAWLVTSWHARYRRAVKLTGGNVHLIALMCFTSSDAGAATNASTTSTRRIAVSSVAAFGGNFILASDIQLFSMNHCCREHPELGQRQI